MIDIFHLPIVSSVFLVICCEELILVGSAVVSSKERHSRHTKVQTIQEDSQGWSVYGCVYGCVCECINCDILPKLFVS